MNSDRLYRIELSRQLQKFSIKTAEQMLQSIEFKGRRTLVEKVFKDLTARGTVCLAHCAPVLVPLFLGEGDHVGKNTISLFEFLAGRLVGYLLFSLIAWGAGRMLLESPQYREIVFGGASIILALATFVGNTSLRKALISATGLRISPVWTGGDIQTSVNSQGIKKTTPKLNALIFY